MRTNLETETYTAPKPQYTRWEWFTFIALRIFFPPLIIWDLVTFIVNYFLGGLIAYCVVPALLDRPNYYYNLSNPKFSKDVVEKHIKIHTHDGAILDTYEYSKTQYKKYIIYFLGNGMHLESMKEEINKEIENYESNIIIFNYRGVGDSKKNPRSAHDLTIDGIAQVQRLLRKKIEAENIILHGHSLGGAIATSVAAHFHRQGKPIYLFNQRSFSSITNTVVGWIRTKGRTGRTETVCGKLLGWLAYPFIKFGVCLVKWEMNAGEAFSTIPKQYKTHLLVRSTKQENGLDDFVICHFAALRQTLPKEERAETRTSKFRNHPDYNLYPQNSFYLYRDDGHNTDLKNLVNREKKNGVTFFKEFIHNTEKENRTQHQCT